MSNSNSIDADGGDATAGRMSGWRTFALAGVAAAGLILLLALIVQIARPGGMGDNALSQGQQATAPGAQERPAKHAISGAVSLLVDPDGKLTLADVIAAQARLTPLPGGFRPLPGASVNLGYTRDTAWLSIVMSAATTREALLSLAPNFVDQVDVYIAPKRPGLTPADFTHYAMGDHQPLPSDAVSGLENVVPLTLGPMVETLALIRINSGHSALTLTASLYPAEKHTLRVTNSALLSGLWFGGMAALAAIQMVFFLFDRKRTYVLLAFSTCMAMMVYMGNLGVSRLWLFPDGGRGNDWFTGGSVWLGLFASGIAGAHILELPQRYPRVNRVFQGLACLGLVGVVFALADIHPEFAGFGYLVIATLATLGMVMGLLGIDPNASGTRLRAAAYAILWGGVFVTMVQRIGLLPLPNWVAHTYAVSCLIQALLLTGSLAVRLRAAEALNTSMREQALHDAQVAERRAQQLVAARTAELAEAKQTAEDALQAELESQQRQVRFMEVISHQYRTPLAVIRSNVDSIGLSLPQGDVASQRRLDRVRRGIVRLVETLEVNMARSRLNGPAFAPQLRDLSLADLAQTAAMRANDMLAGQVTLHIQPEAMQAKIPGDPEMLGLAIINLLENAVKYSAATGGAPVTLGCAIDGDNARITVTDQGAGIPAAEIGLVTERAVRGSNAVNTEGSGLGLSLVSRIVAAHGGQLKIDSEIGVGTTVAIMLPLERLSAS